MKDQISTTPEQGERLIAAGLKPSTADMSLCFIIRERTDDLYWENIKPIVLPYEEAVSTYDKERVKPCWSITRLLSLIPKMIKAESPGRSFGRDEPVIADFQWSLEGYDQVEVDGHTEKASYVMSYVSWYCLPPDHPILPGGLRPESLYDNNGNHVGFHHESLVEVAVRCIEWLLKNDYLLNPPEQ